MKTIGVALGPDRLVADLPGGRQLESSDVANLRQAFIDLKKAAGVARARVAIALIPPLVDLRRVTLPPLRPDERRRVLERDSGRYFAVRDAQVVASDAALAAAAPAQLIEELESAVAQTGWMLDAIVPAHVAWAAHLGDGHHAVRLPLTTELLRVSGGRVVERARLRPGEAVPAIAEIDPYAVAAKQAALVKPTLALRSSALRSAKRAAAKRRTIVLSAAAALCLLVATAVDYWGLGRELTVLRSRRAAIAPQVAAAMAVRDSISSATAMVQALENLEATIPSWSSLFADLADEIPPDAYLASFEAKSDSFAITGVAREAAGVLRGLAHSERLTGIRTDGPIRQDVTPDGVVRERFRIVARLAL